jgi:hypothetical protein
MSERSTLRLPGPFTIKPKELVVARKRVPVDARDYIPLMISGHPFKLEEPQLRSLGQGAVEMSLGRPFGFAVPIANRRVLETQRTDGLILAPVEGPDDDWLATLETADPLTLDDISYFTYGIKFYAGFAKDRLRELGGSLPSK